MKWLVGLVVAGLCLNAPALVAKKLPFEVRFQGKDVFDRLVEQAQEKNWAQLSIGERAATIGKELTGTPYKNYTLEIDDYIEAPSVNLNGLDCWTFFEVSLAFARMLELPSDKYTPETMLEYIELDRYRKGKCNGSYLSRLHYLADWLFDNAHGGMVADFSKKLGGVPRKMKTAPSLNRQLAQVHWQLDFWVSELIRSVSFDWWIEMAQQLIR